MTIEQRAELLKDGKIVGSKKIIFFLRAYMDLHDMPSEAWRTIKRWQKMYNLPVHREINGKPSIIPDEIVTFFALTPEGFEKGVTKGDFLRMLKKSQ